jgi:hypothetical protein
MNDSVDSRRIVREASEEGFRIDDNIADTVEYAKRETELGYRQFDVVFKRDGQTIANLRGLSTESLLAAVGEKNAGAILAGKKVGHLKDEKLNPAHGKSPAEQARQIDQKIARTAHDSFASTASQTTESIALKLEQKHPNSLSRIQPQRNQIETEDIVPDHARRPVRPVPESIVQKYSPEGARFYDRRESNSTPAFTDRGDKLSTGRSDDQVAHDMVAMASARGWREIELKGSEEFRRAAWVAAEVRGIQTSGYTPTEKDIEAAAHRHAIVESRETSDITARSGKLPDDLVDRARHDPEALKEAGIRALAKAVSRELLKDPKLQRRFEEIVAENLRDRARAGQPLPAVKLRGERAAARERDSHREPEMAR